MQCDRDHSDEAKESWKNTMTLHSPTFQYWDTTPSIELSALIFIRSHHEKKLSVYVESLKALVPWFFSLHHHDNARWIPIHIQDMEGYQLLFI